MRADINFSKLSGIRTSKGKRVFIFAMYFLLVIVLAGICAVYAYFTSTEKVSGNLNFGEIKIALYDGENSLTSSSFATKFNKVSPGDTLDLSNINIKNTGTHTAYVLVNLDVQISKTDAPTLKYNQWYNVYGEEVNINDFAANTTAPNIVAKDSSIVTNIKWKFPSQVLDNTYQSATANVRLTAFASQTYLEEAAYYVDADLYASYYICKNATYTVASHVNKNLLDPSTFVDGDKVLNGITWEVDGGQITANGTATADSTFTIWNYHLGFETSPLAEKYTEYDDYFSVSLCTNNEDVSKFYIKSIMSGSTYANHYNAQGRYAVRFSIIITSGTTVNNQVFLPMVVHTSDAGVIDNTYESYFESTTYAGFNISGEPLMQIVGKNLFNDSLSLGYISSSGANVDSTYNVKNDNILIINNNVTISFKSNLPTSKISVCYYADKVFTRRVETTTSNTSLTTQLQGNENGIRFYITSTNSAFATSDLYEIQMEYGSTATAYEVYSGAVDSLDFSNMQVTRKVGKYEFTGEEEWEKNIYGPEGTQQFSVAKPVGMGSDVKRTRNSHFNSSTLYNGSYVGSMYNIYPIIDEYNLTTVEDLKAWLAEQYINGNPVTVWYELTEDKTETIYTNKNLYEGPQNLHFETGEDNNIDVNGLITITKNANYSVSGTTIELGGDVFNAIYNKNFVVSLKTKHYSDDLANTSDGNVNKFNYSIAYVNSVDGNKQYWGQAFKETDGKYGYYHFNNTINLEYYTTSQLENVTSIQIYLRTFYSAGVYGHFDIKDIQLEIGTSPTDFEVYDQTAYARVNGEVLRTVNGVRDTYTYSYNETTKKASGTITRYIGKQELVASEAETWILYSKENEGISFYISNINKKAGYQTSVCSHFDNVDGAWNLLHISDLGIYSDHNGNSYVYFRAPAGTTDIDTVDEFKTWLTQQNENGQPVTIWYQLATTTTESI